MKALKPVSMKNKRKTIPCQNPDCYGGCQKCSYCGVHGQTTEFCQASDCERVGSELERNQSRRIDEILAMELESFINSDCCISDCCL